MKNVFRNLRATRAILGLFLGSFCFSTFAERWTCSALYFWFDKKGEFQSGRVSSGDLKMEDKKADDGSAYKMGSGILKMPQGYSAHFSVQYANKGDAPIMYLWAQIRKTTGRSLQMVFRGQDHSWIEEIKEPDLPKMPLTGLTRVEYKNPAIGQKLFVSNPETLNMSAFEFENAVAERAYKADEFAQNDLFEISVDCMYSERGRGKEELLRSWPNENSKKNSFKIPPAL
jgi:hypothetical protein